jgi:hypothetical protein
MIKTDQKVGRVGGQVTNCVVDRDGLYAIIITALCRQKQNLRVEIDGRRFRELPPVKNTQLFNIPAAYNGTKLKGKTQTNVFILNLQKGAHVLDFVIQNGAEILEWKLQKINDPSQTVFNLNLQAENYDRQPWVNFILVDLPLYSIVADVSVNWHSKFWVRGDGDDVKLAVDNQVFTDNKTNWLYRASKQQAKTGLQTLHRAAVVSLQPSIHYIQFTADQSPVLRQVALDLSSTEQVVSYVGDFRCRTDEIETNGGRKKVLGIYKYGRGGRVFVSSNENYRLYFNGEEQSVGDDLTGISSLKNVQFDLLKQWDVRDDWYYFGIDTTFAIVHFFDWYDSKLWSVYEK